MAELPNFLRIVYPYASFPRLALEPGIAHPVWITDTTLRDGQQGVGPFAKEHMVAVYGFLHRLGGPKGIVRQTEMFVQLEEDRRAIEACIELGLPFPKVVGWVRPNEADLVWADRLGLSEVGVLMSVSDTHIYRKLRKDRKSVRETYLRSLVQALEMGLDVSLHLEDVTRSDVYGFVVPFLQEVRRLQDEVGRPFGVRLCDTLGLGVPFERAPLPRGVPALVRTVLEEVGLSSEQLEWHGHNDFHMAQANALAAWVSGCSGANGTLFGIGERAGNTPIDALVLAYIGLKGDEDGMEPGVLSEAAAYFRGTMGVSIPGRYPLFGEEALRTKAGIHAYGMLNDEEAYSAFDTHALLGLKPSVTVSKTSGVSGVAQWINAYFGLEGDLCLTKETKEVREVFRAIKESYEAGRVFDYQDAEVLETVKVHAPCLYRRLVGLQQDGRGVTGDIDSQQEGKMERSNAIERAKEHFAGILKTQLDRLERIKSEQDWVDYATLKPVVVGILGGDGIGPHITNEAVRVLEVLLKEEIERGKIEFRTIDGLTIERRVEVMKPIPDEVLAEIKKCQVLLKGPTTTPKKGDPWPNIESANVAMRKELDLFANVRPVRVPKEGIDWIFFRENTEDVYALGSDGIEVTPEMAIDFKLTTRPGSERIARLAFEHAKKTKKTRVTAVTKANVVKATDGMFLHTFYDVAKEYPDIQADDWFIDIMTAKLVDTKRRTDFQVLVLPNLYGDILTDEAAEFQGGVGTAGSANIGKRYAMFEAIHGSAPRMVQEGRAQYADPASMIRASAMMLQHIGYSELSLKLEMALDICGQFEKKFIITGRSTGVTGREYCDYILGTMADPSLKSRWEACQKA